MKYAQRKSSKYSVCYLKRQYSCELQKVIDFNVSLALVNANEFVHTCSIIICSIRSQVCGILNSNWMALITFC